jgi:hypothetical protein
MTIEQSVDEIEIPWPAASCANDQIAGQMCLGTGRESGDFLMSDM